MNDTDTHELAQDTINTVRSIADELDENPEPDPAELAQLPPQMQAMAQMGLSPAALVEQLAPSAGDYVQTNPEKSLRWLARLHLETEALLDKHAPDTDPESLL